MSNNSTPASQTLIGFMMAIVIPGACSYGLYVDFKSVSLAIMAFSVSTSALLTLGLISSKLEQLLLIAKRN